MGGLATEVSREDIRAGALARTVDARGADEIIAGLEALGMLTREAGGRPGPAAGAVAGSCGLYRKYREFDSSRFEQPMPPDFDLHDLIGRADRRLADGG